MMFQGSDNVGDEAHFKIISESGGTLNGSTNTDRTNYYETVPSNQLEKVLWLEADRMGFFLDAVTEDKFENQRETVTPYCDDAAHCDLGHQPRVRY